MLPHVRDLGCQVHATEPSGKLDTYGAVANTFGCKVLTSLSFGEIWYVHSVRKRVLLC